MAGEEGLETVGVEDAGFDELEQARLVFGAAHLQGDGREMFGGEDARGNVPDRQGDGFGQSLLHQRAGRWQKLHGPASDDDVFALHAAAARGEVIENGLWADEPGTRIGAEGDEDVHVEGRDRLQVERGPHGPADGVALDHAVGLHLVNESDDFNDVHGVSSSGKLVQGDVVLDVVGNELAVFRGDGAKVFGGENGIRGEVGQLAGVDDVANLVTGGVGLEVGFQRGNGFGFVGLVVGDELEELLFEQVVLRFEARDEAENLFEDFAETKTTVHGGGFAELVEVVELGGLIEEFLVHIVDDAVPLAGLDAGGDEVVLAHGVLKLLVEHAVDLHALLADGFLLDGGEDVIAEVLVGAAGGSRRIRGIGRIG